MASLSVKDFMEKDGLKDETRKESNSIGLKNEKYRKQSKLNTKKGDVKLDNGDQCSTH